MTAVEKANVPFEETATVAAPSARTRPEPARPLTVPPTVKEFVPQLTITLVTAPPTIVPVPPLTVHVCDGLEGWAETATSNVAPLATGVVNVKLVAPPATVSAFPPLSVSVRPLPTRPRTVPPTA